MYKVYVEANEPWHDGVVHGFNQGILDYVESDVPLDVYEELSAHESHASAADGQLTNYDESYLGWGSNVHEDADGFVFANRESAEQLANALRSRLQDIGATVAVHRIPVEVRA